MYDRWSDAFNVMTEFVVSRQSGKMVATAAWLMAMTSLKTQAWNSATAQITGVAAAKSRRSTSDRAAFAPGVDLSQARIVWEALGQEPFVGHFTFTPANIGNNWVEVEAQLPDGRRVVAATNLFATLVGIVTPPLATNADMIALYHLNTDMADSMHLQSNLTTTGSAALDPVGLHFQGMGNNVTVNLRNKDLYDPAKTQAISVEAKIYR